MKRIKGFTLIEILIALTIFSIMAAITSSVLYSVFNARDKTVIHAAKLSKLQIAFVLIKRDFEQIVFKSLKTELGYEASVSGSEDAIKFSRGGITNPLAEKKQSTINRIYYYLDGNNLIRQTSMAVDVSAAPPIQNNILLKDISKLSFEYIDAHNQSAAVWYNLKLPKAIRITLESKHWGKLSQIYQLSQSRQYHVKN